MCRFDIESSSDVGVQSSSGIRDGCFRRGMQSYDEAVFQRIAGKEKETEDGFLNESNLKRALRFEHDHPDVTLTVNSVQAPLRHPEVSA